MLETEKEGLTMRTKMLMFTVSVFTLAGMANANTFIHCRKSVAAPNGGTLTGLSVYATAEGGYAYYAFRCTKYHGNCGDVGPHDYESYGKLENISYNGAVTKRFKNETINIFPVCGTVLIFEDKKLDTGLVFEGEECVYTP